MLETDYSAQNKDAAHGEDMRHIFVVNPIAGNGNYQQEIANNIQSLFKDKKISYEIYYTKFKGDAYEYIKNKSQDLIPTVFYACGGDGTLHEVVNAAYNFIPATYDGKEGMYEIINGTFHGVDGSIVTPTF